MIKILGTSASFGINDRHSYHDGSIGNIAHSLFYSLTNFDVELYMIIKGADISNQVPRMNLYEVGSSKYKLFLELIHTNKILKKEKIDVITQLYFFYNVSFNPLLKVIKDYPFVIGMCEIPHKRYNDEISKIEKLTSKVGKKLLHPLFLKTLDACDRLIAVNEPAKDLYSKHIPRRKIKVIPYGADMNRFEFTPLQENNHNILVVSRLIKRRKLDTLISAMPLILNEYPDAQLHIVGEGVEIRNLLPPYGSFQGIFFHGNVNGEKLINLYKNCYVYCSPSKEDGWNQPILEAMSSGRPVICSDTPHNSMVTQKTGFKLHYNDCIEYAHNIKRLFGDFDMAEKMGEEGRVEVEKNYNWDDIGRKYYKIFRSVMYGCNLKNTYVK